MTQDTHHHKCTRCGERFQCEAPQSQNFDGYPEVVCWSYHEQGNDWCEDCLGQMLVEQAHDEWWEAIGSPELDRMHEEIL